jgi:L-lactate dehydrogenase complex protein LldG
MSSREKILAEIRSNKPAELPLPETFTTAQQNGSLLEKYTTVLQSIGGSVKRVQGWHEVLFLLQQKIQSGLEVVNGIPRLAPYSGESYAAKNAAEIEAVHTVFLKGEIAVAENGAIWLSESAMINRLLPFLCQELVLVIEENNIVADMHQAYQRIKTDKEGYGAFIAGPSKTADIEQALVIGAHGPLSLQVFVIASIQT